MKERGKKWREEGIKKGGTLWSKENKGKGTEGMKVLVQERVCNTNQCAMSVSVQH